MIRKILFAITCLYATTAFAAVELNQASEAELDAIRGVGPGISGRILQERQRGNFKDWNDFIARVGGVGEKTAARYSAEGLTVNGKAFRADAPARSPAKAADRNAAPAPAAASESAARQ